MRTETRTIRQQAIAAELAKNLNIDYERIRFLNPDKPHEPWLPPEALTIIARKSGEVKHLDEGFSEYIPPLNQVVHHATVITKDGTTYGRCGVATVNERATAEIDAHTLAAGRAISAALNSAGLNPLRPGAAVDLGELKLTGVGDPNEVIARRGDLARIHILAKQKGLIVEGAGPDGKDDLTKYRNFLSEKFDGATTAAGFDPVKRSSLIEALSQFEVDEFEELNEPEGMVA